MPQQHARGHKHVRPVSHRGGSLFRFARRNARRLLAVCASIVAVVAFAGGANAVFTSSTASVIPGHSKSGPTRTAPTPPPRPKPPTKPKSRPPVGSAPVGDAAYPVPAGALFVAPNGSDSAAGSAKAPFRTIGRAVAAAPAAGTIVLRQGTYHESVAVSGKKVTIQNYPHEAAWLDGSSRVSGWARSGSRWVKQGWNYAFDHSPTYTRGAPDGTSPGWQWLNPKYPMAAHPDQFWAGGTPLRQVASLGQVTADSFYVDQAGHRAYVGTDPAAHQIRASTIGQALTVNAAGSVIRGIGVRRFAPSVPQLGAVTLQSPSVTVENVVVSDTATTGLFAGADDSTLKDVSVQGSGLLGIGANEAYGINLIGVNSSGNNTEHFNTAPVSGGVKITRSRGIVIRDSEFDHNTGPGIWLDESTYGSRITGNRVIGNTVHGVVLEISAQSVVADNLLLRNGDEGIKVDNTTGVQLWNNTVVGRGRPLDLVQDKRIPTSTYARDDRRPFPDPTMTWVLGPVTAGDNVLQTSSADCLLCNEDYTHKRSAAAFGIHANGNVYNRPNVRPSWSVVWSRGAGDPDVYDTLSQFHAATGQEATGRLYEGLSVVNSNGVLAAAVLARKSSIARPLPSDVAAAVGRPSGSRQLGSWTN